MSILVLKFEIFSKNIFEVGQLGKDYCELSRGYEKVTESYSRPYILGVNILDKEKPFVFAVGDHHSDSFAAKLGADEVVSGHWDKQIILSNSENFIKNLKTAIKSNEEFPQRFLLDVIKK